MKLFILFSLLLLNAWGMPKLVLPTENTSVFNSRPNDFYMYVNRFFEGKGSQPWEAGTYGFVRNMKRSGGKVIGTRFHEGADIKPVRRDKNKVPLDPVLSIASGRVAYINPKSNGSNYGKYVVVQHNWGEGPICSLYAHLNTINCEIGQQVKAGSVLGVLGYTGAGIDKTRAHLHFEIGLVLSDNFEGWHQAFLKSAAGHGNYNGLNLAGMNGIQLIKAQRTGQANSVSKFLKTQTTYYSVTVPAKKVETLRKRYPWLWVKSQGSRPSTEISFSASGLPLMAIPSDRRVTEATLTRLQPYIGRHEDRTLKRISGSGKTGRITERGNRYLALILGDF